MEMEQENAKVTHKSYFWLKLILFLLFALIIPCTYLIIRFDLLHPGTRIKIGLWGIIVLIILMSVVVVLIRTYIEGMKTKYSWLKQFLSGFIRLIMPLCILLISIYWVGDNLHLVKEALFIIIPCEFVAICVNPLPKWKFDNNVEGLGEIVDKVFGKKGESK